MILEIIKNRLHILIILGVVLITFTACSLILESQEPQLNKYRIDILKAVQEKNVKCDYLILVINIDGNGFWSLDPLESQIHKLAQNKLDKGDCLK